MQLDDLRRLKLAIDTSNPSLYHGDWSTVLNEVVEELLEVKEAQNEIPIELDEIESHVSQFERDMDGFITKIREKLEIS